MEIHLHLERATLYLLQSAVVLDLSSSPSKNPDSIFCVTPQTNNPSKQKHVVPFPRNEKWQIGSSSRLGRVLQTLNTELNWGQAVDVVSDIWCCAAIAVNNTEGLFVAHDEGKQRGDRWHFQQLCDKLHLHVVQSTSWCNFTLIWEPAAVFPSGVRRAAHRSSLLM